MFPQEDLRDPTFSRHQSSYSTQEYGRMHRSGFVIRKKWYICSERIDEEEEEEKKGEQVALVYSQYSA